MSKLAMESSFCIWLARDNIVWQSAELKSCLPNTSPPESSSALILKAKIKNNLKNSPAPSKPPVGFISKGNTCYSNTILTILQALGVIHWRTSSMESAQLSPLVKSIALNRAIKEKSTAQLMLQIFCGHSSAKFHLLAVLLLILTPSRMLQKF